jgi:hypothetical protein
LERQQLQMEKSLTTLSITESIFVISLGFLVKWRLWVLIQLIFSKVVASMQADLIASMSGCPTNATGSGVCLRKIVFENHVHINIPFDSAYSTFFPCPDLWRNIMCFHS